MPHWGELPARTKERWMAQEWDSLVRSYPLYKKFGGAMTYKVNTCLWQGTKIMHTVSMDSDYSHDFAKQAIVIETEDTQFKDVMRGLGWKHRSDTPALTVEYCNSDVFPAERIIKNYTAADVVALIYELRVAKAKITNARQYLMETK